MKILVLRFSSIGDIVLTTPVIRALKKQLGCQVHFACKMQYAFVLEANPYIDQFKLLEDSLSSFIRQLKTERYDFVVDLHNNLRTKLICWSLGVPYRAFDKLNWQKWLLVNFKVNIMPAIHIVERYLAAAAVLGIRDDGGGLDYHIPPNQWFTIENRPFAAFVIGGQHFTKRLPVAKAVEAIERISMPVVLLGGKEDIEAARAIVKKLGNNSLKINNLCGQCSFHQSASVVAQASVVFTNDTGLMHVAAAFRKKTYCFWGNTTPILGMYPFRTEHIAIENNALSCRPCSKIGFSRCPRGHFACMNSLKMDFEV